MTGLNRAKTARIVKYRFLDFDTNVTIILKLSNDGLLAAH